jgi:hypothetical protein
MADIELKGGYRTTDPRLDRVPFLDPASRSYPVRELLGQHPRTLAQKRRHIVPGATLDQGQQGACSGFSITHGQESTPFRVKGLSSSTAREWYFDNQRNDDWPGGEYPGASPTYSGSSVIASMKTLQQLKLITSYRWIGAGSGTLMDDLRDTLKYVGPVHFGTNWYNSMFDAQPSGLLVVDKSSGVAGGHAYCVHDWVLKKLSGTPKRREYVVVQNSWGTGWGGKYKGQGGFAYVPVEDAESLLTEEGGEGAVPIKDTGVAK